MKTEIQMDETCSFISGEKKLRGGEYPFPDGEGDNTMVNCVHCDRLTALTESIGDKHYGVIGMAKNGVGMVAVYDPDEMRQLATQLNRMADYIDENPNG